MSIGKNIQRLRLQHGLSQQELANAIGVTNKAVSAWENERIMPRMGPIQRMADYFGVKKSDIIETIPITLQFDTVRVVKKQIPLNEEECNLINSYRELNDDDKSFINGMVDRLSVGKTLGNPVNITKNIQNNKNGDNFMNVGSVNVGKGITT